MVSGACGVGALQLQVNFVSCVSPRSSTVQRPDPLPYYQT